MCLYTGEEVIDIFPKLRWMGSLNEVLIMKSVSLVFLTACSLLVLPAFAGPRENGNLYGAAENCHLSTQSIPTNNGSMFDNARQNARQSSQNCAEVQNTLRQLNGYGYGRQQYNGTQQSSYYANNQNTEGNLYGATEACGFSTNGLNYSSSNDFQNARNTARGARQNCQQVQTSRSQFNRVGISSFIFGNRGANGNLFGAAEACGFSTNGLATNNSGNFQNARQRARQSRQNCAEVQNTLNGIGRF